MKDADKEHGAYPLAIEAQTKLGPFVDVRASPTSRNSSMLCKFFAPQFQAHNHSLLNPIKAQEQSCVHYPETTAEYVVLRGHDQPAQIVVAQRNGATTSDRPILEAKANMSRAILLTSRVPLQIEKSENVICSTVRRKKVEPNHVRFQLSMTSKQSAPTSLRQIMMMKDKTFCIASTNICALKPKNIEESNVYLSIDRKKKENPLTPCAEDGNDVQIPMMKILKIVLHTHYDPLAKSKHGDESACHSRGSVMTRIEALRHTVEGSKLIWPHMDEAFQPVLSTYKPLDPVPAKAKMGNLKSSVECSYILFLESLKSYVDSQVFQPQVFDPGNPLIFNVLFPFRLRGSKVSQAHGSINILQVLAILKLQINLRLLQTTLKNYYSKDVLNTG
ncbi:hypothetical protein KP509_02G018900 [Ceratopteris richardii]|uniref:Uncharacterized protein n=1 Tax=Ceratopteris richardii TaxID=49495 RepID=A0A8T2V3N7_CERRI|nr:hypothetical protein KP509_02G018900 [Ceratopteris richardii]